MTNHHFEDRLGFADAAEIFATPADLAEHDHLSAREYPLATLQVEASTPSHAEPARAEGLLEIEITRVLRETAECRSFEFTVLGAAARTFKPKPGQFIRIHAPIAGAVHERAYAVSCFAARGDTPRFTVKLIPSGLVSTWCHRRLQRGMRLVITEPTGPFYLVPGSNPLAFLAAGIGIAPIFPMVQAALHTRRRTVRLATFNRDETSAVFRKELRALARKHADLFQLTEVYDDGAGTAPPEAIAAQFQGLSDPTLYMCGPPGFLELAEREARAAGIARAHTFSNSH